VALAQTHALCLQLASTFDYLRKGPSFRIDPLRFFQALGLNPFTLPHIWSSGRRAARRGHDAGGSSLV
jgi:hypothetical protein